MIVHMFKIETDPITDAHGQRFQTREAAVDAAKSALYSIRGFLNAQVWDVAANRPIWTGHRSQDVISDSSDA